MPRSHLVLFACLVFCLFGGTRAYAETRLALVIGEGRQTVNGPARDAGIVARALEQAGFVVTGHADLDRAAVRRAFDDFAAEARRAGPDTVVFVYLAGFGVQLGGDDYLVPVEAMIAHESVVPAQAIRLADPIRDLAAIPLKARIVVLDLARANTFAPLAIGLTVAAPVAGSILALNAAPGTVADIETTARGLYAEALSEMMATPGLPIEVLFARVRARVVALSEGATMPWAVGTFDGALALFPPVTVPVVGFTRGSLEASSVSDAFWAAIVRDTLPAYVDTLKAYPTDPLIARLLPALAIRREALFWMAAARARTAPALWTYMRRYPRGPHFADARLLLAGLPAALEPPPRFDIVAFPDLPPPKPHELDIVNAPPVPDRTRFEALPAPPPGLLPPVRVAYYDRPPMKGVPGALPIPAPIPLGFAAPEGRILLSSRESSQAAPRVTNAPDRSPKTEPAMAAPVPAIQAPVVAMPREASVAPIVVPTPREPMMPIAPVIGLVAVPPFAPILAPGPAPRVPPLVAPAGTHAAEPMLAGPARKSPHLPLPPRRPMTAAHETRASTASFGGKPAKKPVATVKNENKTSRNVTTKGKMAVSASKPKGAPR